MHRFREIDWAVPPQPPVAVDEDGIPDRQWLSVLACLVSSALSVAALITMVRLVF